MTDVLPEIRTRVSMISAKGRGKGWSDAHWLREQYAASGRRVCGLLAVTANQQYIWDGRERLSAVILADGSRVEYAYDTLGRRVSRTAQGITTRFLYDGDDVVLDIVSDGRTVDYLNGPGIDNKLRQYDAAAGPLYFLQNDLGSTIALTSASGSVVEMRQYEAYGSTVGSAFIRYGYTGRELDPLTGLMYYRARWYDPQQGTFISEDPLGTIGSGTNLYGYVFENPINANDPSGADGGLLTLPSAAEVAAVLARIAAASGGGAELGAGFGAAVETGSAGGPIGALIAANLLLLAYDIQQGKKLAQAHGFFLPKSNPKPGKTGKGCSRDDDDECEKEWESARQDCRELLSQPNPPRGLTGGHTTVEGCAKGFVSQRCGGNRVDGGK